MPCAASHPRVSLGWGHRGQPRAKRCLPYLPFSHRCRVTGNEHIAYLAYLTYLSYLGAGSLGAAEGAEALAVLTLLTMLALLTLYSLQTPYSGGVYLLTVRTILIIPTVLTTYDRAGLVEWRGRRTKQAWAVLMEWRGRRTTPGGAGLAQWRGRRTTQSGARLMEWRGRRTT